MRTFCWFLKTTPEQMPPGITWIDPPLGVTVICVQPEGMVSVTVWTPAGTSRKAARPLLSLTVVCTPSKEKVNWATEAIGCPWGVKVSFVIAMQPRAGREEAEEELGALEAMLELITEELGMLELITEELESMEDTDEEAILELGMLELMTEELGMLELMMEELEMLELMTEELCMLLEEELGSTCLFLNVTVTHWGPAGTLSVPPVGVTPRRSQPEGRSSVTVCMPGETFEKCARPSLVLKTAEPPSRKKLNWGVIGRRFPCVL